MIPKFRAWHKELEIMMSLQTIWLDEGEISELELNDSFINESIPVYRDEVALMQSTGLFDKNGEEIYDGGVVEWEHKDTKQLVKGVVKYDMEFGFWGMTDVRFKELKAIGYLSEQNVTVLGNKFENPELMEE